jgi:glycosyltransferase involved in cell wall biosynthesis
MIRLLHVFHSFALGGSQARLIRLIDAFGDDYEHLIVSLTGDGPAMSLIGRQDLTRLIDARTVVGTSRAPWLRIRRAIKALKPDRLLTYNWGSIDWAMAALGCGVPHVAVEDGFGPEESDRRFLRRSLTRSVVFSLGRSQMLVPSRTLAGIAAQEWRIPAKRLHVVPNGVDPRPYAPVSTRGRPSLYSRQSGECVIGSLAGLRPEKSLDRMIEAIRLISKVRPVRLVIAGAGPLESSLRAQCERDGLGDSVVFAGFRSDPAAFLHELDLFMLSSETEQLPISMIEAMLSALPVVSTDVGDVKASLPARQQSWVVDRSAERLANAVLQLLAMPGEAQSLGVANRAHALQYFAPHQMLDGWHRVFQGQEPCRLSSFKAPLDSRAMAERNS